MGGTRKQTKSHEPKRLAIGRRIKRLRENQGLSRQQIAAQLAVDLTAIAAWEAGKYLPREVRRVQLAGLLNLNVASLFAEEQHVSPGEGAVLIDILGELPGLLRELLKETDHTLKAFRIAAPHPTPAHIQEEFRILVDRRLMDKTIRVERIEIFYRLPRLMEVLSNILRYAGRPYRVKAFCPRTAEVMPGMGGYIFDDQEFVIGAYWGEAPPQGRAGLRLSGEPFRTYFTDYWNEIWPRGQPLNGDNGADLFAVREVALQLGLEPDDWPRFIEQARKLDIGDGLPPMI